MSDEPIKPSKSSGFSRRGFFRVAGGAAATAASGNPAAIASAAQQASKVATAGVITKIAQMGGFPSGIIRDVLPSIPKDSADVESTHIINAMRERLMGGGTPQRHREVANIRDQGDVWWNENMAGKVNIRAEQNAVDALKRLPKDIPLQDLLSEETLEALYGDKEGYNNLPAVTIARSLWVLIGPLCDETTTAPDIVENFMGFFRKCAKHALENPDEYEFIENSENSYKWDREAIGGHSTQDDIIKILRSNASGDGSDSDLIDQLTKSTESWKSKKLDQAWDAILRNRADARVAEDAKRVAQRAAEEAERLKSKLEWEERKRIQLENPEERSGRALNLEYLEGDTYFVHTAPCDGYERLPIPEHEDWLCWLQTFNPEAKAEDISVASNGKLVSIQQIPENARALQALWRTATTNSHFTVKLPNNRVGFDLNQQPNEGLPVQKMPYTYADSTIKLNIQITEVNATDILSAQTEDNCLEDATSEEDLSISKFFRNVSERHIDELTGLKTPSGMLPDLAKEMKYRKSAGYADDTDKIIAAHVDIKQFKNMNNDYGYATGDLVLSELAQRINDVFRHDAVIGRVQGDELLLLFHRNGQTMDRTHTAIRNALDGKASIPFSHDGKLKQLGITLSVSAQTQVIDISTRQKHSSYDRDLCLAA